jgi:hypothetical protein
MDLQNWCEYMRDVKELAHLTNAYVAKEAEVSIKTIERIMTINIEQDIMRATASLSKFGAGKASIIRLG